MATDFKTHWLADVRVQFEKMKRLAEGALAQAHDDDLNVAIDKEANSLAVMVKHMAGNLRSRFSDFLTTDGEKPNRNRDGEFEVEGPVSRDAMLRDWESGWQTLFRQMTHHSYHVGQIVFLTKHLRSEEWKTLSMPRRR